MRAALDKVTNQMNTMTPGQTLSDLFFITLQTSRDGDKAWAIVHSNQSDERIDLVTGM